MSDVIEVAGLVCIAVAVFLFLGGAAFVLAVGVELLAYSFLLGWAKRRVG